LLTVVLLSGCLSPDKEQAKPELLKPARDKVEFLEVQKDSIVNELNGVGSVIPREIVYAQYPIEGKLAELRVKPGDRVRSGDVLMTLDPGTLEMDLRKQLLEVELARQALEKARTELRGEEVRVEGLSLEVQELKLKRLQQRQAQLELKSPVEGTIVFAESLKRGDSIASYRDLVGIAPDKGRLVQYMAELGRALPPLEKGTAVQMVRDGKTWEGRIVQSPSNAPITLDPRQAELNSKTLLMEFAATPEGIALGETVEFRIQLERKDNAIKIPRGALRTYQGRTFVHILEGETRKEVDVERGMQTATEVEIKSGLKEGQKVIVN